MGHKQRAKAHEENLKQRIVAVLSAHGIKTKLDERCSAGVVDIFTEHAIFEVKCSLDLRGLYRTLAQVQAYWSALNSKHDLYIVSCCVEDSSVETFKNLACLNWVE